MLYKKLNRAIQNITSQTFPTEQEMLISVINELLAGQEISIEGARIWQFLPEELGYRLLYQTGKMEKISPDFILDANDYPIFDLIIKERTIFADETNLILRQKGIFKYTATGVGFKIKRGNRKYYEYLLAFNSPTISQDFKYLLNIISAVLTSKIKHWRAASQEKFLKADIDKARQLQRSILPQHEYSFHDYELYGLTVPAEIIGGDFFDYIEGGEEHDRLGIVLGDAASKGIGAAAEAMYISGALRMASTFEIKIVPFMRRLNQLVNRAFGDDKFSSLFYGELSSDNNGLFVYSNAGHNPPMFLKRDKSKVKYLMPSGPVLGPTPNASYTLDNINFEPGDVLLIYSDGITEAADIAYESFGEERLEKLFIECAALTPTEIALRVIEEVIKFEKNGSYSDDKTVVVIKKMVK